MTQLAETRRTLSYADGQQVLTLSRTYPTDVDDLWNACTDAERIPQWFLPVSGDLRPGGSYELAGNAHARSRAATRRGSSPRPGSTPSR